MTHDPGAYDHSRDDTEHDRVTEPHPDDRRIFLDAICGASSDYRELDSEGVMWT